MKHFSHLENILDDIISHLTEMVYLHDLDGNIIHVNRAASEISGYSQSELLQLKVSDIDPEAITREDKINKWVKLDKDRNFAFDATHISKTGEKLNVHISLSKIQFENKIYILAIAKHLLSEKKIKNNIQSNKKFLDSIFEEAPSGMIYQQADGKIIKWNKKAAEIFGIDEKEIDGHTTHTYPWKVYKEDGSPFEPDEHPSIITLNSGKSCYNISMKVVRKNGDFSWILVNSSALYDSENKINGAIISFSDVSEIRRLRESLVASQNRVIDILETIPDILAEVDQNKRYVWGNIAAYEFFGEDFIGMEASEFFHGNENIYKQVEPLFKGEKEVLVVNSWQKRQDGEIRLLMWSCKTIKNRDGSIKGTLSSAKDITDIFRIDKKLRESEEKFSNIFHQSPIGTELYNKNGKCILINKAVQDIFGVVNSKEIMGFDLFEDPNLSNETKYRIRNGESFTYDFEFDFELVKKNNLYKTTRSGKIQLSCFFSSWILDKETPEGYFLHLIDITKQKKLEEKLLNAEKNEKERIANELKKTQDALITATQLATLGQVSASISHELKNPLGSIRNAAYILKKKCPANTDEMFNNYIDIIDKEVMKASDIINNILSLAKNSKIHKSNVLLIDIINDASDNILTDEKFKINYSEDYSTITIPCDRSKIAQVFVNLFQNSIQAIENNIQITISYKLENEMHTIFLQDNGPGIDSNIQQKIFEPLISNKSTGTGLGLTICRQIIEKHGGKITICENEKKGACFKIELPSE